MFPWSSIPVHIQCTHTYCHFRGIGSSYCIASHIFGPLFHPSCLLVVHLAKPAAFGGKKRYILLCAMPGFITTQVFLIRVITTSFRLLLEKSYFLS